MNEEGRQVSINQLCRWFGVPRSTFYYKAVVRKRRPVDERLERKIWEIIQTEPSWGLRLITAVIRRDYGRYNRKKIHRIIRLNNWQVVKKPKGHRPRVKGWGSRTSGIDERWSIDTTHILCGRDGWAHLTAVIDCCDRNIVGWRFSASGSADIATAALEDALRFRGLKPGGNNGLVLRSDNGLVFGSKKFCRVVKDYNLTQEFITPYTPEQNGVIERFFRTMKEECIWGFNFKDKDEAFDKIAEWLEKYHTYRPHSALNYMTPDEFRRLKLGA